MAKAAIGIKRTKRTGGLKFLRKEEEEEEDVVKGAVGIGKKAQVEKDKGSIFMNPVRLAKNIKAATDQGFTTKEIQANLKNLLQQESAASKKQQSEKTQLKEAISGVASETIPTLGSEATASAAQGFGNIAKFADFVNPRSIAQKGLRQLGIGENIPTSGELVGRGFDRAAGDVREVGLKAGVNPEDSPVAAGVGRFIGDLAPQSAALATGAGAARALPGVGAALSKVPGATFGTRSLGGTAAVIIGKEGELPTGKKAAIGGAIDVATKGIGKLLTSIAPNLFRLGVNVDGPGFKEVEEAAQAAVGKFKGTKKQILGQVDEIIETQGKEVDRLAAEFKNKFSRDTLTAKAKATAESFAEVGLKTEASAIIKQVDNFVGAGGDLSVPQMVKFKRKLGKILATVFGKGKAADPSVAAKKQALLGLWKELDTAINSLSPEIKAANEAMTVAFSIKGPLEKELKKGFKLNLFDLIGSIRSLPGTTAGATTAAGTSQALGSSLQSPAIGLGLKTILQNAQQ